MTQQPFEHVSFDRPDEVREGKNWRLDLVNLAGGAQIGRLTIQPGFRWTEHVKPVAGTDLCMAPHQQYHVTGRIHIVMEDGSELIPESATVGYDDPRNYLPAAIVERLDREFAPVNPACKAGAQ